MKIVNYRYPKSSFISVEKDMGTIVDFMLKNKRLKKLLYYTTKDCLARPELNAEQEAKLISDGYIRMVPKIHVDRDILAYVIISFDNYIPNQTNPHFRDNTITFDIICHLDQWQLKDFQLRPFKIAAELDMMFNEQKFSGIGTLKFLAGNQIDIGDEFAGFSLTYAAIHAEDDQINSPNEVDQKDMDTNFDAIFNNKLEDLLDL